MVGTLIRGVYCVGHGLTLVCPLILPLPECVLLPNLRQVSAITKIHGLVQLILVFNFSQIVLSPFKGILHLLNNLNKNLFF